MQALYATRDALVFILQIHMFIFPKFKEVVKDFAIVVLILLST